MRALLALLMVAGLTLAGCSGGSDNGKEPTNADSLDVTETTGGIRGVVVDDAIKPIGGARVALANGPNATTKDDGTFSFTGLAPGEYFVGVTKPGYKAAQLTTPVVANVAEPAVVKVLLERITTAQPYQDTFKLDGFYECAFALNFITDGCDFAYRTAYDEVDPPAGPRTINKFSNTQYITIPADTFSIIQEGFWQSDSVPEFLIMLDETPIDNSCDCSDTYQTVKGESPLLSRLDKFAADGSLNTEFRDDLGWHGTVGDFPADVVVAARGFVPPPDDLTGASYALNMQFTILTTLFHNYVAPDGWTFETRDQHPVPK